MISLQKLTVEDANRLVDEDPVLMKLTNVFCQVINNFAQHVELRGVIVLDDNNCFSGVITRTDLLDWASAKLGAFILRPLTDMSLVLASGYV